MGIEDFMWLPVTAPCPLHVKMAILLLAFWPAAQEQRLRELPQDGQYPGQAGSSEYTVLRPCEGSHL